MKASAGISSPFLHGTFAPVCYLFQPRLPPTFEDRPLCWCELNLLRHSGCPSTFSAKEHRQLFCTLDGSVTWVTLFNIQACSINTLPRKEEGKAPLALSPHHATLDFSKDVSPWPWRQVWETVSSPQLCLTSQQHSCGWLLVPSLFLEGFSFGSLKTFVYLFGHTRS